MKYKLTTLCVAVLATAFAIKSTAQPYYVTGDFNGWDNSANIAYQMTSNSATDYSFTITNATPGGWNQVKVLPVGGSWTTTYPGGNLHVPGAANGTNVIHFHPGLAGDGWLPLSNRVGYEDSSNSTYEVIGDITNPQWGDDPTALMTEGAGGQYSLNYTITTAGAHQFKIRTPGSWNNANISADSFNGDGANFSITTTSNNAPIQVLLDLPGGRVLAGYPAPKPVTNHVVFVVDMAAQINLGLFNPASDVAYVSGGFNGWPGTAAGALALTNVPTWAGNTNVYYATNDIVGLPSTSEDYKFTDSAPALSGSSGYEPRSANRNFSLLTTNGTIVLPFVSFGDASTGDYLPSDITVNFSVDMNSAVARSNTPSGLTADHPFNAGNGDTLFINGNFYDASWNPSWNAISLDQMTETPPGSGIYTYSYLVRAGHPVEIHYKYGIHIPGTTNTVDDEANFGQDHVRNIRITATNNYTFPQDTFGNQHNEPSFGNLVITGSSIPGKVSLSWLGRPGTHVQSATSLNGSWTDLNETDGTNWLTGTGSAEGFLSTSNISAGGTSHYFRMIKPFVP